jgi:U3 small nucleolar RNA-associated protein 20
MCVCVCAHLFEITLFVFHLPDSCVDILQIIQHVVKVVGSESSEKIITSVSPLLTSAGLEVRVAVCDVLNALSESDISVLAVVYLFS